MKEFKGRVVTPGCVTAEAVVTHGGFNTLASLQSALQFGDKTATCNCFVLSYYIIFLLTKLQ